MSMKKLFFLFAFLVGLGISSSVYAQLVKEVTLTSSNTLAYDLESKWPAGSGGLSDDEGADEYAPSVGYEWGDGVTESWTLE